MRVIIILIITMILSLILHIFFQLALECNDDYRKEIQMGEENYQNIDEGYVHARNGI